MGSQVYLSGGGVVLLHLLPTAYCPLPPYRGEAA